MPSVTKRISMVKQPRGGYLNPKDFEVVQLENKEELAETESISPGLVGTVVDYMTRFMLGTKVEKAFEISILGARLIGQEKVCAKLLSEIKGLDDRSLTAAAMAVGYDVCFRAGPMGFRPVLEITPDAKTRGNMRIMIERSLDFIKHYGPITVDGFTFEGGYTKTVDSGDGDYLTADTLWDFKVSTNEPTNKHTLQLLMYFIMGQHSKHGYFKTIRKLGIFNPRLNKVYLYEVSKIPVAVIEEIEKEVIGY